MPQDAVPELSDYQPTLADDREAILTGLTAPQKHLAPKYFYDARGSALFDRICELPEYYPTRTELAIMRERAGDIAAAVGPRACLVEFGSGSSVKIRLLLKGLDHPAAYVPVEISRSHLLAAAGEIAREFPALEVLPVCADFTQPFELPATDEPMARVVAWFPGSTIGNFEPKEARRLLEVMRQQVGDNGGLLIGVDLQKDRGLLERAYNDAAGVTAEFNLNLLRRLNRELGANFDLRAFRHHAHYDAARGRIEMNLISLRTQQVALAGTTLSFDEGEVIVTEYSHKFTREGFAELAASAGFRVAQVWTDPAALFSVQWLEAAR
ncbi:MAG: L-histidine N(alpha)-methyltransferase [Gammaproteobacteria bacterium]|nr:MAG: L-histidine N(alpha)-methyltransferase [Gammaproteobacteria bacterium]